MKLERKSTMAGLSNDNLTTLSVAYSYADEQVVNNEYVANLTTHNNPNMYTSMNSFVDEINNSAIYSLKDKNLVPAKTK